MALHRDFMMRMLEKLSAAFFRMVAGKTDEAPEQVLLEIEELVAETLNTSPQFALAGPAAIETVHPSLAAELARLLLLHGRLSEKLGRADRALRARTMAVRAIQRALERPNAGFATVAVQQMREHRDLVVELFEPAQWGALCMNAHQWAIGNESWTEAEDWAFFAVEADPSHEVAVRTFFQDLLDQPDDVIEAGGLTRAEVLQSLADLEADD